ncbi:LL-diaminopimelate aminotransferase [Candidatus Woesearchaeota archaeon]|nr:LL-diaminopimelate aminotransferase [Candidatus Woesearchaeota archaeon]
MVKRNINIARLPSAYLFPEIGKRKKMHLEKNPNAKIISLGIGNTTEPITPHIASALKNAAQGLGTVDGYTGYGEEQGMPELRKKISSQVYNGKISPEEVFISDGAKCDIARLQVMFGSNAKIAVQDPSYPVYVDGSIIMGQGGDAVKGQFGNIVYMQCTPENNFFPDLGKIPKTDLIYFCSPNNPTGAVATKEQLTSLVGFARKNASIIIFDAAYSEFISERGLPKTIYEIDGAKEVAIEINSFSKSAGFTGVRLGWSVVPNELKYADGYPVRSDWNRIVTTLFNGASNIAQHGGIAALDDKGLKEIKSLVSYYMENASMIRSALESLGIEAYGGINAPYIWARMTGKNSWDTFERILDKCNVVTTPGSGFGPAGEGFIRFSAFGHHADVREACDRMKRNL